MTDSSAVPTFAIVGQPNEGKTSIIATLAEDDRAPIGPSPGTTRRLVRYPVRVDDEEIMVLFDTPGFESPGACLEWLQAYRGAGNPARAFVEFPKHHELYPEECEILQPLAHGAAVIYVVDGDREPREPDRQEAEILRLCGCARIGVINSKLGHGKYVAAWTHLMRKDFNTRREFNACTAVFADRIDLLQAAGSVEPDWTDAMRKTITALTHNWDERLENAAQLMLDGMERIIQFRAKEPFDSERAKALAKARTQQAVEAEVRATEQAFRAKIRKLFRHHEDHWELPPNLQADIFSAEVWRLLGLSKTNLILGATVAGASAGVLVDLATLGHSFGFFAAGGGVLGGIGAWLFAEHAVRFKLPRVELGPFRIPGSGMSLGGTFVEAGIERRSKLPGILLDRMLLFILSAASWAHGKHGVGAQADPGTPADPDHHGPLNTWGKDDRLKVMAAIEVLHRLAQGNHLQTDKADTVKQEFRNTMVRFLKTQTMDRTVGR